MIIIHAVQKLQNISRLKPALFVSEPSDGQELHSWYAKLVSTSFKGKMLVMYVHQPSLIVIIARGKTISGTMTEFQLRLENFLNRFNFGREFIQAEINMVIEGYIISKTNSRSMLGSMNAISENITYRCTKFDTYAAIEFDKIENTFMEWLTSDKTKPNNFSRTSDYWRERGLIQ